MRLLFIFGLISLAKCISIPQNKQYGNLLSHKKGSIKVTDSQHLIELSPSETKWMNAEEIRLLQQKDIGFIDITDHNFEQQRILDTSIDSLNVKYPSDLKFASKIRPLLAQLKADPMHENLETFSSFWNRYYLSDFGRQSSEWLFAKVNETLALAGALEHGSSVIKFNHTDVNNYPADQRKAGPRIDRQHWNQASVIARIPGISNKTIVVGAHQDSLNAKGLDPNVLRAPGADDNGSGCVTILETMRVLLSDPQIRDGKAPNTIEFHWYSAEEAGLLGSQDVFWKYSHEGRDIKAMFQQDMTGYVDGTLALGRPEAFGIVSNPESDQINVALTNFIKGIIKTYTDIPYVETTCGYGCSDHASATKYNYPSAFVIESALESVSRKIHSPEDTIDTVNFSHMVQHAKLTLGMVYELAFADLSSSS